MNISVIILLFLHREIVVLDEPLSSIVDEKEVADIFRQAVDNLIKAGKTVIVSSQNPSVSQNLFVLLSSSYVMEGVNKFLRKNVHFQLLQHCNRIYLAEDSEVTKCLEFEELQMTTEYDEIVQDYYMKKFR